MGVSTAAGSYRAELDAARHRLAVESKGFARLGLIRLAVFLAGVAAAVAAALTRSDLAIAAVGAAAVGFLALIVWHERIARRRERAERSVAYSERGLARLEHRWSEGGDDGARFADERHLYAADLELFGHGSLFHYLSTARTETGAATLAGWLRAPAEPAAIVDRQAAVAELAGNLRLRHDLAVIAGEVRSALDSSALRAWLAAAPAGIPGWVAPAAAVLALVNLAATLVALAGWVPGWVVLPGYSVGIALALSFRDRTGAALHQVDRPARELKVVATLVERVSRERFRAPRLVTLLGPLTGAAAPAAGAIRRLERLVDLADARRNQLFYPVAALLLLGTQLGLAVERWRRRLGPSALGWLEAIGELEALATFATLHFERPGDAFPAIGPPGAPIAATGMAHPLLPLDRAVPNDLALGDPVRLLVVSGSNMSGKSTFLKALGVNLALGYAGAPVRATGFSAGQWAIGASLVLRESLLEGRSRFYAEILRLQEIVAAADAGRPVLFLLDELLSGTNSHDRAVGAEGIVRGLLDRGAIGIVTTHDLALTEIATRLAPQAENRHFEDALVEGKLRFEYHLAPGVVRRSNALELMRAVGLLEGKGDRGKGDGWSARA